MKTQKMALMATGLLLPLLIQAAPYTITDLGSANQATFGYGVNINGEAVGLKQIDSLSQILRGIYYDGMTVTELSAIDPTDNGRSSFLFAINDAGQAVGSGDIAVVTNGVTTLETHAIVYENGGLVDLGIPANHVGGRLLAINNMGVMAGYMLASRTSGSAVITEAKATLVDRSGGSPVFTVVGTLRADGTGASSFRSLSDSGMAAGWSSEDADGDIHAVIYDSAGAAVLVDLGTVGGTHSEAWDVNMAGLVVGESSTGTNGELVPFTYQVGVDSQPVALPLLDPSLVVGRAYAVNNNNDIVGAAVFEKLGAAERTHAVLWQNGQISDLNNQVDCALGWTLLEARDINDAGQIVGTGLLDGQFHAFLLTPDPNGGSGQVCRNPGEPDRSVSAGDSGGSLGWTWLLLALFWRRRR
jgi:probable HAF family extracellular repeat protein